MKRGDPIVIHRGGRNRRGVIAYWPEEHFRDTRPVIRFEDGKCARFQVDEVVSEVEV